MSLIGLPLQRGGPLAELGLFFPRVRTPCGHGAQVIIEGREIQSDGGEKDKDNPTTKNNRQPQPKGLSPSLVGPQEEITEVLWVRADADVGLHRIPYYWAGVFVLEAARFLPCSTFCPRQ